MATLSGPGASSAAPAFVAARVLLLLALLFPLPALAGTAAFGCAGETGAAPRAERPFLTAEQHVAGTTPPGAVLLAMGGQSRDPVLAPDGSGTAETGGDSSTSAFLPTLKGSFLGALLFGYPFEDLGLPDLGLLALLGFLLVWRFLPGPRPKKKKEEGDRFTVGRRDSSSTELPRELRPDDPRGAAGKRSGQGPGRWTARWPDGRKDRPPAEDGQNGAERAPFRRRLAMTGDRNAWGRKSAAGTPPAGAGASWAGEFDPDDFLEGARVFYLRMREALAERDTESLAPFMTPDMMRLLRERAAADPHPVSMRVMLLDASLAGLERQDGEERAGVNFSVLLRTDRDAPVEVREIWRFVRGGGGGDTWRLAGIEGHEERQ